MKKLLTLFLFCCPFLLAAQVEFAPVGATWYYGYSPGLPWEFIYVKVEVTGIDSIQGRACKHIESTSYFGGSDWGCSPWYPFLQVYQENGRVYYFKNGGFHLLYNFDAVAGESWFIKNPSPNQNDSLEVHVDSVSLIVLNGQTLKVQHIPTNFSGMDWGFGNIIEGIGNTNYITPQLSLCDPQIYGLRCYQDDSLDLHFANYPCDTVALYSATREPILHGGLFAPNPVFDNFIALIKDFDADIVVLQNTLGTTQRTFLLDQGGQMEITDVASGIYFASIFKGKRLVGMDKLVVYRR